MASDYKAITRYNEEQLGKDTASRKSQVNMYSDFSHFIYEILQNADDYGATTTTFCLNKNELVIEHNGSPFKEKNVKAISYFGKSTSRDDLVKTGRFGLGFKSVFAFTASPAIESGNENFEINDLYRIKALPHPHDLRIEQTRIRLPFNHMEKRPDYVETLVTNEKAFDKISYRLKNLDITTLLFTHNILEINWNVQNEEGDSETGHYLRGDKSKKHVNEYLQTRRTEITDGETLHTYLVFSRRIKWQGKDRKPVDVAFYLDDRDETEVICSSKKALFVLFPTTAQTHMGFLMNGPFRTPAHRETVSQDDEFNQFLMEEIAELLCQSLLDIRAKGLLSISLLETLPIRTDDFPEDSMFYPIVSKIRVFFLSQDFLPADDETLISAQNAKLASAEWLRKLLRSDHLQKLFKTEKPLKWISGEISKGAKHDLWKYIKEELEVEEVTPDSFARKIESSFIKIQTDDWMIAFYTRLIVEKALWQKGINLWDKSGPLRTKQFIRLQNGSHVKPFRDDGSPNAYHTSGLDTETSFEIVKTELTQHEDVRKFLSELEIPKLDIVAEVFERILKKYSSSAPVPRDEHMSDLIKIERAYATDSKEKKRKLRERLRMIPFILTEKPGLKKACYQKPIEAYFRNDELTAYFSGCENVGFVISDYGPETLSLFEDIGVANEIRVKRKPREKSAEYTDLGYSSGHRRGLKGFDPDIRVDGLEDTLMNPSVEKSEIIWNKVAAKYEYCIRGKILRSSREDFSPNAKIYKEEQVVSDFGRLLMENDWLPSVDGFVKPCEITLDDLPSSFIRDEKLADQLGIRKNSIAKLAEQAGISPEVLEYAKLIDQNPEIRNLVDNALKEKAAFPKNRVSNPDRRQEKILEQLSDTPEKKSEPRTRSIRVTKATQFTRVWLKEQYTNDDGQMVCQICKQKMPFKNRNGEHYFEAVEILSSKHFTREHEAQFLALCPLCAAMYKEFLTGDEDAMEVLKSKLLNADDLEVPIFLGEIQTSIQFVHTHYFDLQTILGVSDTMN